MSEAVDLYKTINGRIYVLQEYALRPATVNEWRNAVDAQNEAEKVEIPDVPFTMCIANRIIKSRIEGGER